VATIHGLFDTALAALDIAYAAEKDPTIKGVSPPPPPSLGIDPDND
jgi:hypothetical protein